VSRAAFIAVSLAMLAAVAVHDGQAVRCAMFENDATPTAADSSGSGPSHDEIPAAED